MCRSVWGSVLMDILTGGWRCRAWSKLLYCACCNFLLGFLTSVETCIEEIPKQVLLPLCGVGEMAV
jgi:hypothetical protein